MKVTDLEKYKNEDGSIDLERLNSDIQKETAKSFESGKKASLQEQQELAKSNEELLAKLEENNATKSDIEKKYDELNNKLNEFSQKSQEEKNNSYIDQFKNSAKGKLSDEAINTFIETTTPDKLSAIDINIFARKDLEDIGSKGDNPENEKIDSEQARKSFVDKIRKEFNEKRK